MDEISIDRLVLDIPGLTSEAGEEGSRACRAGASRRRYRETRRGRKGTKLRRPLHRAERQPELPPASGLATRRRHRRLTTQADRKGADMAGKYLRGAFIEFTESFPLPVPNVILFQYNPETMTHTWTPSRPAARTAPGAEPEQPARHHRSARRSPSRSPSSWTRTTPSPTAAPSPPASPSPVASTRAWPRWRCCSFPRRPPAVGLSGPSPRRSD